MIRGGREFTFFFATRRRVEMDGFENFNCIDRITSGVVQIKMSYGFQKIWIYQLFLLYLYYKQNDMNKTSQDYQRELRENQKKMKSLDLRIKRRFIQMVGQFPDAVVYHKDGNTFVCRNVTKEWLDNITLDTMLEGMRNIEEHNALNHPHVQLDLFKN